MGGGGNGSSGSGSYTGGTWTGDTRPERPPKPGMPPAVTNPAWLTWQDSPEVQEWLSGMPAGSAGQQSDHDSRGGSGYSSWMKGIPTLPAGASGKNNKAWTTFLNALLKKGAKPPGPVSSGAMANLKLLYPSSGDPGQWVAAEQQKIRQALGQE